MSQHWPRPIVTRALELMRGNRSLSPARAHLQLKAEVKTDKRFKQLGLTEADVPSERTLYNWRERQPSEDVPIGEEWSLDRADPIEALHVLPVLGCVIDYTEGRVTQLRKVHARWIARIRAALPEQHEWPIYIMAGRYARLEELGEPTAQLDLELAAWAWAPQSISEAERGVLWARGHADDVTITPAAVRGMETVPDVEWDERAHRRFNAALEAPDGEMPWILGTRLTLEDEQ